MNELQKYKEIQRRTKLLYGVKDVKRMIDKSKASVYNFKNDICNRKKDIKISGAGDDGEESDYRLTNAY